MQVKRPVALIDPRRCRNNIIAMADKLNQLGIGYRPHFKTHQSGEIGNWYRESGVTKITVSSPSMAEYFIKNGWKDITIAFPVTHSQFKFIQELAGMATITVFLNDPVSAGYYADNCSDLLNVFIEIDTGHNRSGVSVKNPELIQDIHDIIDRSAKLNFYGFYVHEGRTYQVKGKENVSKVIQPVIDNLTHLKSAFPGSVICLGDTPSCSMLSSFDGIDEMSPGNHVFFDCMQLNIGSCSTDEIAMAVACPVAQIKKKENEVIIHGGAVHFSKDRIYWNDRKIFGLPVSLKYQSFGDIITDSYVADLSQEHGIVKGNSNWISSLNHGDSICVFPVHSCLSANLFDHYRTIEGNRIDKRILS